MNKYSVIPLSLLVMLAVAATPVQAKKPQDDHSSLPKGLQKKVDRGGELPPGWQKKLQKGEVLDRAVVSSGGPVSAKIKATLPLGTKGSVEITLDGKVIRLDPVTRKVLDVFRIRL